MLRISVVVLLVPLFSKPHINKQHIGRRCYVQYLLCRCKEKSVWVIGIVTWIIHNGIHIRILCNITFFFHGHVWDTRSLQWKAIRQDNRVCDPISSNCLHFFFLSIFSPLWQYVNAAKPCWRLSNPDKSIGSNDVVLLGLNQLAAVQLYHSVLVIHTSGAAHMENYNRYNFTNLTKLYICKREVTVQITWITLSSTGAYQTSTSYTCYKQFKPSVWRHPSEGPWVAPEHRHAW